MLATLTAAEIRCDQCLAQLPPQIGENGVLARIRAAQNGWVTVGYSPPQIVIATATRYNNTAKICLPASGEFCPSCEPLPTEQWFRLCQKRLADRERPFSADRHRFLFECKIELAEYKPVTPSRTSPVGQLTIAAADRLVRRGTCTWDCLLATEQLCTCRCGGPHHGAAIGAYREMRQMIHAPEGAA